ncbi:MAG: hypothetical protein WAK57_15265 [Desulfobacterales bacterium]
MFNLFRPVFKIMLTVFLASTASPPTAGAGNCSGPRQVGEATLPEILQFVQEKKMIVLTFTGFSGAGYENPAAMIEKASEILRKQGPEKTVINIGATREGIGAVYEVAKAMGFTTMGIVSALAQAEGVALSQCVDYVFYVQDDSWGGRVGGEERLSPTSEAIVAVSSTFVGIGGGDVARDELSAARKRGKPVVFIPADMNHRLAREKALKRGEPEPTDFRGSAHAGLAAGP